MAMANGPWAVKSMSISAKYVQLFKSSILPPACLSTYLPPVQSSRYMSYAVA